MIADRAVVITGISTGIGWAAAESLVQAGFHVFGSVRKPADGERARQAFGDRFTPLLFDVTDDGAIKASADQVKQLLGGKPLFGLVNNAGIAVAGPLAELPLSEFRKQFDVNVTGLVAVTQAFAPLLGASAQFQGPPGRIINISSVAGKVAMPLNGAYAASKHAVEGLSDALRRELLLYGIDVILIEPGPVKTAIWGKAEETDLSVYENSPYKPVIAKMMSYFMARVAKEAIPAEDLGRLILMALTTPAPKPRYVITHGLLQHYVLRYLPTRMIDRMIGKTLGLLPR
jgi:NAD(P)-dependent dehydrogenase (short-subunit alcohol dehydrogenase family)